MQVFISFSGERSRLTAEALKTFIEDVLQAVRPFMSSDMPKGISWPAELAARLEACQFGIICITPENVAEGWILFEAGALSKAFKGVAVPYLVGIEPSAVPHPLGLLQAARADAKDTRELMKAVNGALPAEARLADERVVRAFETFWPALESKLRDIAAAQRHGIPARKVEDMVKEILDLVRAWAPDRVHW
jgi:hypothetical protein